MVLEAQRRLNYEDIWNILQKAFLQYGRPKRILSDKESAFIAEHLKHYFEMLGIETPHITSGSSWQNGYAEPFISRFKDEGLNREFFGHIMNAQMIIEEHERPTTVFVHIHL